MSDEIGIKTVKKRGKGKPIQKGQVLNPHGRPRKEDTMSDCIREYLAGEVKTENGETLTRMQIAARAMYKKSISGDSSMFREMLDRGYGKVAQRIEAEVNNKSKYDGLTKEEIDKYLLEHGIDPEKVK